MASELSKLIENELEKVEGANRKDEHQKRLSSLRVKTPSPERTIGGPHPALRFWTKRRVVVAALAGLVLVATVFLMLPRRTAGQSSSDSLSQFDAESSKSTAPTPPAQQVNSTPLRDHHLLKKAQHPEKQGQITAAAPKGWGLFNAHRQHPPGSVQGAMETEEAGDAAVAGPLAGAPDSSGAGGLQEAFAPALGAAPGSSAGLEAPGPAFSDLIPAAAPDESEEAAGPAPVPAVEAEVGG